MVDVPVHCEVCLIEQLRSVHPDVVACGLCRFCIIGVNGVHPGEVM